MAELGAGGGSGYPAALDSNTSLEVDSGTLARADVPNDLAAAVVAVQTELGTDPAGTKTNVKTYLQIEHQTDGTHWRKANKTADYTVATTDNMTLFEANTSGNDITFALPALASATDSFFIAFKKTHASNSMILDGNSSETIDGATTQTYTADNNYVILWSNGSDDWQIISDVKEVVADVTPQLGGNLDVNGQSIISASNGAIAITPNGSGDVILDGQKFPQADGSANQIMQTNGSAQISWATRGAVRQCQYTINSTYSATTGVAIPVDDTIPQKTEGTTAGMDRAITPGATDNVLVIEGTVNCAHSDDTTLVVTLLQDTTADALAAWSVRCIADYMETVSFRYVMAAGTTSATTFKVYVGPSTGTGTTWINGGSTSGRKFGGVARSILTVTEYLVLVS